MVFRPPASFAAILAQLGLTGGLQICLDAGDAASYSSGQKWLDRSGSGQDFFLGPDGTATAADPTFNGVAGALSANEFWSFDGAKYFRYNSANEPWMQTLHKDNATFTIAGWIYPAGGAVRTGALLATFAGGLTATDLGILFYMATNQKMTLLVGNGAGSYGLVRTADAIVPATSWHFVALSQNEAGNGFFYMDGAYAQVGSADTWAGAVTTPGSGNAAFTAEIFSMGNATVPSGNGSRCGAIMVWNVALTKEQLDSIYNATGSVVPPKMHAQRQRRV